MDKQEILAKLEICISILENTDNVYMRKQLEHISETLVKEWNESDYYSQQIKEVLRYDETMTNLNNITIWKK